MVWEYLPALNLFMESLKEKKKYYDILAANLDSFTSESHYLSACLGNVWIKTIDYVERINDFPIYVAFCVLNSKLK